MLALKGYFNGKEFIPLEKVEAKPNQKVIITLRLTAKKAKKPSNRL